MRRWVRTVARASGLGLAGAIALAALVCGTMGCSTLAYYAQSVNGHLDLLQRARPVPQWLADAQTNDQLRQRLVLSQEIRDYAVRELGLPDNASYRRYADLQRGAAVWNVVAAPELSLKLTTWCFPVVGCVGTVEDVAVVVGQQRQQLATTADVVVQRLGGDAQLFRHRPHGQPFDADVVGRRHDLVPVDRSRTANAPLHVGVAHEDPTSHTTSLNRQELTLKGQIYACSDGCPGIFAAALPFLAHRNGRRPWRGSNVVAPSLTVQPPRT